MGRYGEQETVTFAAVANNQTSNYHLHHHHRNEYIDITSSPTVVATTNDATKILGDIMQSNHSSAKVKPLNQLTSHHLKFRRSVLPEGDQADSSLEYSNANAAAATTTTIAINTNASTALTTNNNNNDTINNNLNRNRNRMHSTVDTTNENGDFTSLNFSNQVDRLKEEIAMRQQPHHHHHHHQQQSPFHHITQSISVGAHRSPLQKTSKLSGNNKLDLARPHSLPIQISTQTKQILQRQQQQMFDSPTASSIKSPAPTVGSLSPSSSSFAEEQEDQLEEDGQDELHELPTLHQSKSATRTPSPRSSVISCSSLHESHLGSFDSLLSSGRFSTISTNGGGSLIMGQRQIGSPSSDLSTGSSCSTSSAPPTSQQSELHQQQVGLVRSSPSTAGDNNNRKQHHKEKQYQEGRSVAPKHIASGMKEDDKNNNNKDRDLHSLTKSQLKLQSESSYRKKSASFIEQGTAAIRSATSSFNLSTKSNGSTAKGETTTKNNHLSKQHQQNDDRESYNDVQDTDSIPDPNQYRVLHRRITVANTPSLALDGTIQLRPPQSPSDEKLPDVGAISPPPPTVALPSSTTTSGSSSPTGFSLVGEQAPQRRLSRTEHRQSLSDLGYGKIESYFKLQKLGKGTYATVYQGRSRLSNELVALKEILKEHDEGAPCTAIREVSLLRLLRHNNIVTLHDICHTPDKLTLVFEYVGQDLYLYMKECNYILAMHNVRLFLYQLLRGLSFCHSRQVLHRDLKPQNLLINKRGELKICDFGLARAKSIPTKSYSNEVVTLWYRPPDVLLGNIDYDHSIDMWGVGCIFFEMASGRTFFPGSSVQQQLYLIFSCLGTPNKFLWPEILDNPNYKRYNFPPFKPEKLLHRAPRLDSDGMSLLLKFLNYRPSERISSDMARYDPFFSSLPSEIHSLPERESIFSIPGVHLTLNPGQRLNNV